MNSRVKFVLKRFLKNFLCSRPAGLIVRCLSLPLKWVLSGKIAERIPITGQVRAAMPEIGSFVMVTDGDDRIASQIYWQGLEQYESRSLTLFSRLSRNSETIFDIGANTGIYSLVALISNPRARIFAFEPVPGIFSYLSRNATRNDPNRMKAFGKALGNFDGESSLFVPRGFQTFPLTSSTAEGFREDCEQIGVQVMKLDSFALANNIARIDLMKLDTESTEHLVIEGGYRIIKQSRPVMICEVQPQINEAALHQLLDPLTYKYFWITGPGLIPKDRIVGDPQLLDSNYLFVPQERITELLELGISW